MEANLLAATEPVALNRVCLCEPVAPDTALARTLCALLGVARGTAPTLPLPLATGGFRVAVDRAWALHNSQFAPDPPAHLARIVFLHVANLPRALNAIADASFEPALVPLTASRARLPRVDCVLATALAAVPALVADRHPAWFLVAVFPLHPIVTVCHFPSSPHLRCC